MDILKRLAKVLKWLVLIGGGLFSLSLVVYFFNLDMKLAAAAQPLVDKIYNLRKREPLP